MFYYNFFKVGDTLLLIQIAQTSVAMTWFNQKITSIFLSVIIQNINFF